MKTARSFFELVVCPTVEEFLEEPTSVRRGFLAAIVLHHLSDYWKEETGGRQDDLVALCPEFALVRDVSNAAKHMQRRKQPYMITKSEQIRSTPKYGMFNAPFGQWNFARESNVWITLDDGSEAALVPAVQAVLNVWRSIYH